MGVKRGGGVGAGFVLVSWLKTGVARMIDSEAMIRRDGAQVCKGLLLETFYGKRTKDG